MWAQAQCHAFVSPSRELRMELTRVITRVREITIVPSRCSKFLEQSLEHELPADLSRSTRSNV
jgi:hypothetical protein